MARCTAEGGEVSRRWWRKWVIPHTVDTTPNLTAERWWVEWLVVGMVCTAPAPTAEPAVAAADDWHITVDAAERAGAG